VPYELFKQLLTFAERWFPQRQVDACGMDTTPIFLKLHSTLRMLGKGCTWDLLYELTGVSAEVHRKWTLVFLAKFSTVLYPIYVHGPRNNEELNKITSMQLVVSQVALATFQHEEHDSYISLSDSRPLRGICFYVDDVWWCRTP
jgi:hypothetical protein